MKSFLLSSFKQQVKVFALISFLVVAGWYGLLVVTSIDDWNAAVESFQQWNSGQKQKCERLFATTGKEIAAIDSGRCDGSTDGVDSLNPDSFENMVRMSKMSKLRVECDGKEKARRAELIATQLASGCPTYSFRIGGNVEVSLSPKEQAPAPLIVYAVKSNNLRFPIFPIAFLGLTIAMLFLGDVSKRVITDNHSGWKRLTLVGSILFGVVVSGWWLQDGERGEDAMFAGISAICIAVVAFVYGRLIFRWVAEGFVVESRNTVATITVEPQEQILNRKIGQAVTTQSVITKAEDFIRENETQGMASVGARFWPRLWARCVDLSLCWLIGSVVASLLPNIRTLLPGVGGVIVDLLIGMAFICGSVFFYESFFISRFGATPGKMLFGLTVVSVDGGFPLPAASRKRALFYLGSGLELCLFVPYFQILGAVMAWRRRNVSQPWDLAARTFTIQKPIGSFRFSMSTAFAVFIFASMIIASMLSKQVTKNEFRESVIQSTHRQVPR